MKTNHYLSQKIINRRKSLKTRENIKVAIIIALVAIIGNLGVLWALNQFDKAYEQRAKLAGYELPVNQVRK